VRRNRGSANVEESVYVAERLRPYVTPPEEGAEDAPPTVPTSDSEALDELMRRAAMLLSVMPRNQHRETIEDIVSPYDPELGRRAIDALIDSEFVSVDEQGRLRRLR